MITPNVIAYFALLSWPFVAIYLFSRRPLSQAIIWTILGAYLLLPARLVIKFEMIPGFDKNSVATIAALIGCVLVTRRLPKLFYRLGAVEILILMLLIGPFITSELNGDEIHIGSLVLPGVGIYDAGSAVIAEFLFFIPFVLGRQFLRDERNTEQILRAIVAAGLIYSLPMLFEIRMSPQLHTWIYGYFPSSFEQQFRYGGFRPVVFLGHGLLAAFFVFVAVAASAALWRLKIRVIRLPSAGITAYLGVLLILCKTLSVLVYAGMLVPLIRWATPRMQTRAAAALVIIALSYPTLRVIDLIPTTLMLEAATSIDPVRAASLKTRFDNENLLLRHASERFWLGWGRFGRSRVYDESGRDSSITDGEWIIRMGTFGFVGFAAEFGLIAMSVFCAASALRSMKSSREAVLLATLALIVAINLVDSLPNASISPVSWLFAGALLGQAEDMRARSRSLTSRSTLVELGRTN